MQIECAAKSVGFALLIILPVAVAMTAPAVGGSACPPGTRLFGWEGSYGCVKLGSNEVVVRCSLHAACPVGWKNAGLKQGGKSVCCPSSFAPLKEKPKIPTDAFKKPRYVKP